MTSNAFPMNVPPPGDWARLGACLDHPELTWFPEHGDSAAAAAAREVCAVCPVQRQCLDHAVAVGERWGIWGGVATRERRRLRKARSRLNDGPTYAKAVGE